MSPAGAPRPSAPIGPRELPMEEMVEAIAVRVVELLQGKAPGAEVGALVDAATLARHLGVSRDYVYRHAEELGAQSVLGERGRGRRLRFDLALALTLATGRETRDRSHGPDSPAKPGRQRRRPTPRTGSGPDLLPIERPEVAP